MHSMLIAFLTVINISCTLFSAEQLIPCNHEYREDECFRSKYDGFCAGTLVKTPSGSIPIEALHIGDYILDPHNQPKKIEGISFRWVPRYCRAKINNSEYIDFGIDQQFYTPPSDWSSIADTDVISTANGSIEYLYDTDLIEESTCLYVLTVEDHIFCITTHDLVVHNAETLVVGALGIVLEHFAISPAVISAVQTTLSLSLVSYRALQEYCAQQDALNKDFNEWELCQRTRQAERAYFEKRKQELENLRDQFVTIKNGLLTISAYNGGINFTSVFFRQQTFAQPTNPANLLLMNEMQLSEDEYATLRTARDMYLNIVEQEVDNLHLIIALHLNAVIENVKQAEEYHWQVANTTDKSIDVWNRMRHETIPADIALQLYEHSLYDYYSLQKAKQYIEELTVVLNFYRREFYRPYLAQTLPLQQLLDKMPFFIKKHEEWMAKENHRITSNIAITEGYYTRNNINVAHIWPQFKAAFEKQYEDKRKIQLFDLKKRQESLKPKYKEAKKSNNNKNEEPKNPRNNDKYENMYEVFARAPIGKQLKESIEGTSRNYEGSKIFKVIQDVKERGIQKGDWLYLDKLHKDHIEVFCKDGKPVRTILNMDGTQNSAKIKQAGIRDIVKWIK